jgi:hypothetical protein
MPGDRKQGEKMRQAIISVMTLIAVALCCSGAIAEDPVSLGFSDPTDTEPISTFRLPDWGYRTLEFGVDFDTRGATGENSSFKEETFNGRFNFSPEVERYQESEEEVKHLYLRLTGGWSGSRLRYDKDDGWSETKRRELRALADIETEWKRYLRPGTFFVLAGDAWGSHTVRRTEELRHDRDPEVAEWTDNTYDAEIGLGLGFGRVRDVTPVIQALRVSERLKALGKTRGLNHEQIQRTADRFAMRSGYSKVHDRGAKYFWPDLLEAAGIAGDLTAFEVYYLRDVLSENLGDRLEGWETVVGVSLVDREDNWGNRSSLLSGFARGRWHRNHSLCHQTGIELRGHLGDFIDGNADRDAAVIISLEANHLWVLADRIVWQPVLSGEVDLERVEGREGQDPSWRGDQDYSLSSDFRFFVEDRTALTWAVAYQISREDLETFKGERYTIHRTSWRVRLALTYYLDRVLDI